jgi:hypothetical protein
MRRGTGAGGNTGGGGIARHDGPGDSEYGL